MLLDRIHIKIQELKLIPSSIWAVSLATLLISISSVMTFSIGPLFMVEVLGLSLLSMGAIEGVTEAISQLTRLFAGVSGDYFKKNKPTMLFGFILATLSKPLFILANGVPMIIASKVMERLSNGIMATPRDAFVSSAAPIGQRGQSLGLLMTMKTLGCTAGSLIIGSLLFLTEDYLLLLWIGFFICFAAIFVLVNYVKEDETMYQDNPKEKEKFRFSELKHFSKSYWVIIGIAGIFMSARFSDSFLILRFKELGGSKPLCASLIGIFNLISAFCCYPIGSLSDRIPRIRLLGLSFLALVLANFCFVYAAGTTVGMIGVILWGIQRGTSQVLLTSMIADYAPRHLIGTALGMFYLITGVAAFISSTLSGTFANIAIVHAFQYGLAVSCVALVTLLAWEIWQSKQKTTAQKQSHKHQKDHQEAA